MNLDGRFIVGGLDGAFEIPLAFFQRP